MSPTEHRLGGRTTVSTLTCAARDEEVTTGLSGAALPADGTGSSDGIDLSRNRYCGPYALAYLLGLDSTADASRLLREISGRQRIRGVSHRIMLEALKSRGMRPFDSGRFKGEDAPTLARWLRGRRGGLYLVVVTGHFIVIDGHRIHDNANPTGVRRKNWPQRRKRVRAWWRFR